MNDSYLKSWTWLLLQQRRLCPLSSLFMFLSSSFCSEPSPVTSLPIFPFLDGFLFSYWSWWFYDVHLFLLTAPYPRLSVGTSRLRQHLISHFNPKYKMDLERKGRNTRHFPSSSLQRRTFYFCSGQGLVLDRDFIHNLTNIDYWDKWSSNWDTDLIPQLQPLM